MADIEWAIYNMRRGENVRRASWLYKDRYIEVHEQGSSICTEDLLADDWEIYEPSIEITGPILDLAWYRAMERWYKYPIRTEGDILLLLKKELGLT